MEYTYESFPESTAWTEGIERIAADRKSLGALGFYGIEYARRGDYPLHLHILRPVMDAHPERKWPLAVFIPGSGWLKQSTEYLTPMLARFASRGIAVAVVEYRPSFVAPFPAQIEDEKTAVRFLRSQGDRFGLDTERIVLIGNSSGGHTVLIGGLTGDGGPCAAGDDRSVSAEVSGIIDLYGPTEFGMKDQEPRSVGNIQFAPNIPECIRNGSRTPESLIIGENPPERLNVFPWIRKDRMIPILMIHGSKDRLVPFAQSVHFFEKCRENGLGDRVRLIQMKGGDHGVSTYWTEKMIDLYAGFIRECMDGEKK